MRQLTGREYSQVSGTSFFNNTVTATPNQIIKLLGQPSSMGNDGRDKVNMEWDCITNTGVVFTIYDWKYYRPLDMDEQVQWHIGAHNAANAAEAADTVRLFMRMKL